MWSPGPTSFSPTVEAAKGREARRDRGREIAEEYLGPVDGFVQGALWTRSGRRSRSSNGTATLRLAVAAKSSPPAVRRSPGGPGAACPGFVAPFVRLSALLSTKRKAVEVAGAEGILDRLLDRERIIDRFDANYLDDLPEILRELHGVTEENAGDNGDVAELWRLSGRDGDVELGALAEALEQLGIDSKRYSPSRRPRVSSAATATAASAAGAGLSGSASAVPATARTPSTRSRPSTRSSPAARAPAVDRTGLRA